MGAQHQAMIEDGLLALCDECVCEGACLYIRQGEQPYFQAYRVAAHDAREIDGDDRLTERPTWAFQEWISRRWREWRKANNRPDHSPINEIDRRSFDAFIGAR